MNIHPSDGHSSAWAGNAFNVGIDAGLPVGSYYWDSPAGYGTSPLTADYKDATTYALPADHIAIMRHHNGACEAYKAWTFTTPATSLLSHFQNDYRTKVTSGGPVAQSVPASLSNKALDPMFGDADGDLYFNWGYGNNGARVALDSQYEMQCEGCNNDATQGFGMDVIGMPTSHD